MSFRAEDRDRRRRPLSSPPVTQLDGRHPLEVVGVAAAGVDLVTPSSPIRERAVPGDRCRAVVGLTVGRRPLNQSEAATGLHEERFGVVRLRVGAEADSVLLYGQIVDRSGCSKRTVARVLRRYGLVS
jgi:hypothetical protein